MVANGDTSKKPSDANSRSLREPVFFVDRSLGRKVIPDALRAAGEEIRVHDDYFPQDAKDEVWLAEAGRQGWIVLTKDKQIRYREVEVRTLLEARVRAFILTAKGDLTGAEVGQIFVQAMPAIKKLCRTRPPPFIARVSRVGKVSLVKA